MKDPKRCEHWTMAFCVADPTIFVECMACGTKATLRIDGANKFTTSWAQVALNKVRDEQALTLTVQDWGKL